MVSFKDRVPYSVETNDIPIFALQNQPSDAMFKRTVDQFDRLCAESETITRVMAISVHPCLSVARGDDARGQGVDRRHAEPRGFVRLIQSGTLVRAHQTRIIEIAGNYKHYRLEWSVPA